jgi:hypothetical protein
MFHLFTCMQSWVWEFYESGPHLRRSPKKWSAIAEGLRNTAVENSSINVQSQKSSKDTNLPAPSFCEVKSYLMRCCPRHDQGYDEIVNCLLSRASRIIEYLIGRILTSEWGLLVKGDRSPHGQNRQNSSVRLFTAQYNYLQRRTGRTNYRQHNY